MSFKLELDLSLYLDSQQGKLVIRDIIPAIKYLRNEYRITFSTLFVPSLLSEASIGTSIEIGDLRASDKFFESILLE